mgnify:CR=1 FL=1
MCQDRGSHINMAFRERTRITVPSGGSVTVTNIKKRPLFIPDDKQVETGIPNGYCLTCNKPTECPICEDLCLANWTLLVFGGYDKGDSPMFGNFTRRYTVNISFRAKDQNLSGYQLLSGTAETGQTMIFPAYPYTGASDLSGKNIFRYGGMISLYIGEYRTVARERTAYNKFRDNEMFSGYGIFASIYRRWDRGPVCVTKKNDNGNRFVRRWPYRYAWSYPCLPMVNYSQWLYEAFRWSEAAGNVVGCFNDRNTSHTSPSLGMVCDEWGGQQQAIYGRELSDDLVGALADKFNCDKLAGIRLPLIKTSKQSWGGIPRTRTVAGPSSSGGAPWREVPYPREWEDWSGDPPEIVLYPSERERYKRVTAAESNLGVTGDVSIT